MELNLITEKSEFDEIKVFDEGIVNTVLKDRNVPVPGVQASYGIEELRGTLSIFNDDFLSEDDGTGASLGIEGSPRIYSFSSDPGGMTLLLQYGLSGSLGGGKDLTLEGQTGDFAYLESKAQLGLALDTNTGWTLPSESSRKHMRGSLSILKGSESRLGG